MFLKQRIFSLSIFLGLLVIVNLAISKSKNTKIVKTILIIYVVLLSIFSFFYIPNNTSDAYRLMNIIKRTYMPMSYRDLTKCLTQDILFTKNLYFFLVSRFQNEHFLPFFTALIYYSICFYMFFDYFKRKKIEYAVFSKFIFYFMICGQFIEVIAGVRSQLAMVLVAWCIYREIFRQKCIFSNLIFYLLAIGMHLCAVPIIVIRLFVYLFQKSEKKYSNIFRFLFILILFALFRYYGNNIISATKEKADSYIYMSRYSYLWEYIKCTINILINIIVLCLFTKYGKTKNENEDLIEKSNIKKVVIFYSIVTISFCFEYNIYHRFAYLIDILIFPLYLETFQSIKLLKNNNDRLHINKYEFICNIILFIMLIITFTRGDLTGIKFFE